MAKVKHPTWLRAAALRLTRAHFLLMLVYVGSIILFDMTHLMAPEIITKRAVAVSSSLAVIGLIWFMAHRRTESSGFHRKLIYALIALDISVVVFMIFTDRGVASREVVLLLIPIISSAVLASRTAIFTTTVLCIAVYLAAVTRYDYLHPNEMYNVELYGITAIFSAVMVVCASLLWAVVRSRK